MLRAVIPRPVKRVLRNAHRATTFALAFRKLTRDPLAVAENHAVLAALIYGWGNDGFSAETEYLQHVIRAAWDNEAGDALECGSGLTTLALAAVAKHRGMHVVALEHIDAWGTRVRGALKRAGLTQYATVCVTPLFSYGPFEWYTDPPRDRTYGVVVCDGPPSTTPGGRYGLWPVMHEALAPGAVILLDDLDRPAEQAILRRWTTESSGVSRVYEAARPFGELRLRGSDALGQ
jgi:predicted O-methyltransferase YrrM